MSLLQRITFLIYTVVQHSLFLWLHLGICHFNVFAVENYIFNLYSAAFFISVVTSGHLSFQCLCCKELLIQLCSILYFCGYIWASVISMSLLQRITFLTYTVVQHSLFLWLHLGICHFNVCCRELHFSLIQLCGILYFCGYIQASVISMSLLQRITFLTYTVVQHSLFLWLHLGICHFNVFAVENYIFNLYSCAAFFISVVTSGHLSFQCLCCRAFFISVVTFLTYTVVWHSLFLWLHLGICHFNVFAVENYIFNLYSCAAFFISVVTSGHLSFQCLCCRELHY